MKKILLFAVIMMAALSINTLNAQVKGGFKMGVDFSKLSLKDSDGNGIDEAKRLTSPRIGFILEVPVSDVMFIHTGVFAAAKGYKVEESENGVEGKLYQILGTVDIPINFGYKHELDNMLLFAMAGPMISYNGYLTTLFYEDSEWDNNNDLKIGTSENDFIKPFNMGINIEAGIEISRFQLSASFAQGLTNLSTNEDANFKTSVIGLAVAIKFGEVNW